MFSALFKLNSNEIFGIKRHIFLVFFVNIIALLLTKSLGALLGFVATTFLIYISIQ